MDESRCPLVWAESLGDRVMESEGAAMSGALRRLVSIPSALKNIGLLKFVEFISLLSSPLVFKLDCKRKRKIYKIHDTSLLTKMTRD